MIADISYSATDITNRIADISYSATDLTNRIAYISYSATDITNRKAKFSNSVKKRRCFQECNKYAVPVHITNRKADILTVPQVSRCL